MRKFPGQGSNSHHSCNQGHSSDNVRSLTHWATTELLALFLTCFCFCCPQHPAGAPQALSWTWVGTDADPTLEALVSFFLSFFFFFLGPNPWHMEVSRLGGQNGAIVAGLRHSHGNARSKLHPQPTGQPAAMPDSSPTERGRGSNMNSHGY